MGGLQDGAMVCCCQGMLAGRGDRASTQAHSTLGSAIVVEAPRQARRTEGPGQAGMLQLWASFHDRDDRATPGMLTSHLAGLGFTEYK